MNVSDKAVFKEMWAWLTVNPLEDKSDWMRDEALLARYEGYSHCPACYEASARVLKNAMEHGNDPGAYRMCFFCPLMKSAKAAAEALFTDVEKVENIDTDWNCLHGLFNRWECGDVADRAKYAKIISELEWED